MLERWKHIRSRYPRTLGIVSFLLGFAVDLLTLGRVRIDSPWVIIQQGLALTALSVLLAGELLEREGALEIRSERGRQIWSYQALLEQFFFGGLISAFAIFYFKSASWLTSWVFVPFLGMLMVLVETERFRKGAIWFRSGVYALCLSSYFAYVVPIAWGNLGTRPFVVAQCLAALGMLMLARQVERRGIRGRGLRRSILYPGMLVIGVFTSLYFLQLIPPVPLSVQYMGVYHGVERSGGHYRLLYQRSRWKFWEMGDQLFLARPGDQIYLFARIFAPRAFKDEVKVRWLRYSPVAGWRTWDVIPITVLGGRDEGFRGVAYKVNYDVGLWRVQLETTDGREIARLRFRVVSDPTTGERQFLSHKM